MRPLSQPEPVRLEVHYEPATPEETERAVTVLAALYRDWKLSLRRGAVAASAAGDDPPHEVIEDHDHEGIRLQI